MATQVFLLDTVADTHLGQNVRRTDSTQIGWIPKALGTARGSGVVASAAVATVANPPFGVEVTDGSLPYSWISPPFAADVTISGTITCNVWASESNMSANVAINMDVYVIRANALGTLDTNTLVPVATTARGTEVAVTTRAVNNFTVTPTSTVVSRGDRLRVRVFGTNLSGGITMASGYTFNASWNGTSAAADGDSYVSFTEDFSFESAPGGITSADGGSTSGFGNSSFEQYAIGFTAAGNLTDLTLALWKNNAPTDNVVIEVQTDSAGAPSGSVVGTVATVAAASLGTTYATTTWNSIGISLSAGSTYWIVLRRSGALDGSNYFNTRRGIANASISLSMFAGGSWASQVFDLQCVITMTPFTVYLTDTASAVSTANDDWEAWTSRGGGVNSSARVTPIAGWVTPIQMRNVSGGTDIDWFTRPLAAFTLGGMAVANLRAIQSNLAANASLRCEIARVDGDGTNATVWGSWCIAPTGTDNGELATSEVDRTAYVSGDDLAISDGQRLRIRVYAEDSSSAAMTASGLVTLYCDGPTPSASGDTYITFPQTLTEYSAPSAPTQLPLVTMPTPWVDW